MAIRHSLPRPIILRLCHLAIILAFTSVTFAAPSPTPHPSATPTPTPPATPTPSATATSSPTPGLALAEIAPQAQAALNTLKGIESGDADPVVKATQAALFTLSKNIDDLREQSSRATASVGSSLDTLRNLQIAWQRLERELTDRSEALGERGRALEADSAQVGKLSDFWTATKATAESKEVAAPAETLERVREVLYNALLTRTRVEARQNSIIDLQNRVGALLARTSTGQESVSQALAAAVKTLFVRESAPLWTPEAQPAPGLATRWRDSLAEQTAQVQSFAAAHENLFAAHAGVFAALFALLWWLRRAVRRWTADEPHLHRAAPIFQVPGATALLLSFFVMGRGYQGAPGLVHAAVGVLALLPTVFLLRRLLAPRLYLVLYSLVGFTLLDQFRLAAGAFPALTRWLFCGEMLAAIGVFLWLLRMQRGGPPASRLALGRWLPALCGLAVAAFAGALLAAVAGYVRLGTLAGTATLQSGYVAVFLYALLRVLDGLTVIALRVRPVSASRIAQTHRDQVQAQVYNVCRAGAVALWLKVTLEQFQLFTPLYAALARVLGTHLPLGSRGVSLGQLLGFAGALWLSTLVSRVLRFFLSEEIYERVNLAPGLPYAISTMVNYGVLLVGFLVALSVLNVDLTKVTIVAGAFSVGLGFGLQNIINNFVSGVILLFERPIKVGDVIQIGDSVGEVRRIGIRASIVRTRDGSDIILPNGGLISGQVTNWTYADRCRAVEIPLTVAAGPDPAQVVALLQAAAEREPAAENRPAPQVYVTALTATGFSVVVRAWTSHYEDWIEVRSELALALNAALVREGVKLGV